MCSPDCGIPLRRTRLCWVFVRSVFRFGKEGRIELLADILNALNDTAEVNVVTNNLFSGNFAKPNRFVDPLRAMIGVKLSL